VFGFQDMDPATNDAEIMNATLDEGVRYLPEDTFTENDNRDHDNLVSMDLTPDESAADQSLTDLVNDNPWLIKYLVDGASNVNDPNDDIVLVIDDEGAPDDPAPAATPTNNNKGGKKG
jgi:hypothetical protein